MGTTEKQPSPTIYRSDTFPKTAVCFGFCKQSYSLFCINYRIIFKNKGITPKMGKTGDISFAGSCLLFTFVLFSKLELAKVERWAYW